MVTLRDLPTDVDWAMYSDGDAMMAYSVPAFMALLRAAGGKITVRSKDLGLNGDAIVTTYHDDDGNYCIELKE